jgi:hypothetical protein
MNAHSFDKMPWERPFDQKFRLLPLFDLARNAGAGPADRSDRVAVDFVELVKIAPVLKIIGARIR